jgi:hypothetical protein
MQLSNIPWVYCINPLCAARVEKFVAVMGPRP